MLLLTVLIMCIQLNKEETSDLSQFVVLIQKSEGYVTYVGGFLEKET